MPDNARDKFWRKALPELQKKLRFLSEKKMEANLDMASDGTLTSAFQMGAEEAQQEMIARLRALQGKLTAEPEHHNGEGNG